MLFRSQTIKIITELWSTKTLNQNYQKYAQMIEQWLETANELDLDIATKESLLLGRQTISQLMNDPLLPEDFVDLKLRDQFAQSVQRLDQIGLELWRRF